MDWAGMWNDIVSYFQNNVWNIIFFFVILIVGLIVIKIVMTVLRKVLSKTKMERIAQQFLCTAVKFALWLVLILLLLSQIGIEIPILELWKGYVWMKLFPYLFQINSIYISTIAKS